MGCRSNEIHLRCKLRSYSRVHYWSLMTNVHYFKFWESFSFIFIMNLEKLDVGGCENTEGGERGTIQNTCLPISIFIHSNAQLSQLHQDSCRWRPKATEWPSHVQIKFSNCRYIWLQSLTAALLLLIKGSTARVANSRIGYGRSQLSRISYLRQPI